MFLRQGDPSLRFCEKIYELQLHFSRAEEADRSTETRDAFAEAALVSGLFVIATLASTYAFPALTLKSCMYTDPLPTRI